MPGAERRRLRACVAGFVVAVVAPGCRGTAPREASVSVVASDAPSEAGEARDAALDARAWRCAETDPGLTLPLLELDGWEIRGREVTRTAADHAVTVGFVADAELGSATTLSALRRAAAAMRAQGAQLVVSLGALGADATTLDAALDALTADAPYLLLALAGDLEPATLHREAVARWQKAGRRIADGTLLRWVNLGAATIAALPGARAADQLAAGVQGCGFDDAMVEATLAAPRHGGGPLPEGDWGLAQALARHQVALAIVGEPTNMSAGTKGDSASHHDGTMVVSVNPPRSSTPSAVLLHLTDSAWRWQRLDLSMQPAP
jgi:hypothetical protein